MEITDKIAGFIRSIFSRESEGKKEDVTQVGAEDYSLFLQYGLGNLNDYLKLDHGLLEKFSDFEEMDEYPDLSCLHGDSLVFTLNNGWTKISNLAKLSDDFYVLSYDKDRKALVPAKAHNARKTGESGHSKQMVKVVFDNGTEIKCTSDHLFMTKDEKWIEAGKLIIGTRIMPGIIRLRSMGTGEYWQVHQPSENTKLRDCDGKRWNWIHRLVANELLGRRKNEIVHHRNNNRLDNCPSNLSLENHSTHASHHIAHIDNTKYFPEWTPEKRLEVSKRMLGNSYKKGKKDSEETRERKRISASKKKLSEEHRRKIGEAHRIQISRREAESAYNSSFSIVDMAKKLNVSWSTARRTVNRYDLANNDGNHRVAYVEILDESCDVYDIEVPEYHNFVCNGVVVHNSALDIYADDTTTIDTETGKSLWVECEDTNINDELNDMLHKKVKVEDDLWEITRTTCKYGNDYEEILVDDGGVQGISVISPATARRLTTNKGKLLGFAQTFSGDVNIDPSVLENGLPGGSYESDNGITLFEPWKVAHFRFRAKHRQSKYGQSLLEPARWIFKRLVLMEDAMLVYKLTRAPARYAFYVDVGDMPPREAMSYVNKVRAQYKKRKFVNEEGKLDMKYNPLGSHDDFWLPTRPGKDSTRIDVLSGPTYQNIEDTDYMRMKLYAAIKIPRAYLGYEDTISRATLSAEDVRFSRLIIRIQRVIRTGFNKICRIHLAAKGLDPKSIDFELFMNIPSSVFESAQMEIRTARAELADRMQQWVSKRWIMENIFGYGSDEIELILKQQVEDALRSAAIEGRQDKLRMGQIPPELAGALGMPSEGAQQEVKEINKAMYDQNYKRLYQLAERQMLKNDRESKHVSVDEVKKIVKSNGDLHKRFSELKSLMGEMREAIRYKKAV